MSDATVTARTIEFKGEEFRLSGQPPSQMALLELAALAEDGADTEDRQAFAVIFAMLQDLVHPDDWGRFRRHARVTRATGEELMTDFAKRATEATVGRPTKRSSDASAGPQRTAPSSKVASSVAATAPALGPADVITELNRRQRPDLAQVVHMRQEHLAASA